MPFSQYLRLIHTMAIMALRADASKYFLGYFWWLLEPLLYVGVFYVVFSVILTSRTEDFLVFLLLFTVLFANGYTPSAHWIWLVPLLVVNYLMIVACAFVGACLVCMVRDFSMIISLGMTFLLFTSGVFWDVRSLGNPQMTEMVVTMNPLAFILDAYRQILMYQSAPDIAHLLLLGVGFGALAMIMASVMRKNSQFLALEALSA